MDRPGAPAAPARRPRAPIRSLGPAAARALSAGPVTPFAAFERSLYVESRGGDIACIGDAAIGAGPLNALLAADWCAPEAVARLARGPFEVDLDDARRWRPTSAAAPAPRAGATRRGLAALAAALGTWRLAEGLGPLLPSLLDGGAAVPPSPLLRAAAPGIAALDGWLRGRAGAPVPGAVGSLIGLGPGLTPSGDDLLGGCLIALRRTGRRARAEALGGAALTAARTATGRISLAHLACAAEGLGAAALHDALEAVVAGGDPGAALTALDGVGHCSGWDALAGAVLALRALE